MFLFRQRVISRNILKVLRKQTNRNINVTLCSFDGYLILNYMFHFGVLIYMSGDPSHLRRFWTGSIIINLNEKFCFFFNARMYRIQIPKYKKVLIIIEKVLPKN